MRVPEHLLQPRQPRLTEDREEERGKRERKSDEETALTPVRDSGRGVSSGPPEPNSSEVSLARVFCLQSPSTCSIKPFKVQNPYKPCTCPTPLLPPRVHNTFTELLVHTSYRNINNLSLSLCLCVCMCLRRASGWTVCPC